MLQPARVSQADGWRWRRQRACGVQPAYFFLLEPVNYFAGTSFFQSCDGRAIFFAGLASGVLQPVILFAGTNYCFCWNQLLAELRRPSNFYFCWNHGERWCCMSATGEEKSWNHRGEKLRPARDFCYILRWVALFAATSEGFCYIPPRILLGPAPANDGDDEHYRDAANWPPGLLRPCRRCYDGHMMLGCGDYSVMH